MHAPHIACKHRGRKQALWRLIVRVFVTGASGYIGGSVANRLVEAGHEVIGLARTENRAKALRASGIAPVLGTLDDRETLTRAAHTADAVINAADSDHRGAVETLTDALAGTGKTLLHASGSSIVGDDARGEATEQTFTEAALSPAGSWQPEPDKAPRVAIDRLVLAAAERGIRSTVLCSSLIYGHGYGISRDSVQLPRLANQARKSGVVRYIGTGSNIWSTVHIDDVIDLYVLALESAPPGSFYFAENGEASFATMAQAIADNLGLGTAQSWDIDSAIQEWGYEPAVYALGSNSRVRGTRARDQLGWKPQHDSVTDWIRRRLTVTEPG
ncbi:NAD-dependent epimerase/dehydratase family protein [Streptomyces yunnanensis]|uniref:NAD-dependent epimerase/dehydratase family protein n=1 Tax=Streptomyces yunnanensis TaxID=156453 RepID=A0ABY8AK44_9ACTN|nr:NAD-dependent epimerase/dehydratase family protein [Streptomyces yunnanensis]WEB44295.1 NAD-dependent epimerase/dehydratase family protein [Streptomyces yunnanensis]